MNSIGNNIQPCIIRPRNTHTTYNPSSCIICTISSTSSNFPAMIEAIPMGEYLKGGSICCRGNGVGVAYHMMNMTSFIMASLRVLIVRIKGAESSPKVARTIENDMVKTMIPD